MWQIINEVSSVFISAIVLIYSVIVFEKIILNEKVKISKSKLFIMLLITCFVHVVACLKTAGLIKTIVMFIINTVFYKITFKISNKKSILLMFIYTILLVIADFVSLYLVTEVLGYGKKYGYEVFAGGTIGTIIVCLILLIITCLLKKPIKRIINSKLEHNTIIVSLSVLTLISILLFFYTIIKEFRVTDNIIIYLVAILVLIIVLFSLIKQTIDNYKLTNEYDQLLEFMTTYENEIENQRILRHEVKNEFRTIRAKICDKQANKEIIEYIDEIVKDKYEVNKEKYAKFGYLPPNGIKGLCYFKTQEAEKRNVNIAVNISKKVKDSVIYDLNTKEQRDFGRILGVILDNAIEASAESEKKQLGIEAYISPELEFKLIVSNTFNNKIEETKIGKERFSTKGKNRGHGLLLVKQLVNKNDIFELKTDIQENLYIQTITIKK